MPERSDQRAECAAGILVRAAAMATPRPRSGAEAGGPYAQEEVAKRSYPTSEVRGKRQRVPGCDGAGTAERSSLTSEARGCSWEGLPHTRGQGRWPEGATPPPRSSGCAGAGEPRGAIPCSRSEGIAVRRYPSSKVRSSYCTLLEQP